MTSASPKRFHKSFTQQEPLPDSAINAAVAVLRSGKLHRYNHPPGETGETARLEDEFAAYVGRRYCLACGSCGSAMHLAMKSLGITARDTVLCNAYTLAPVPGAIENTGADVQLVEITDGWTIDFDDLQRKASASQARWLLLSHMRGHIADMQQVVHSCQRLGLELIEDCAHTMGSTWDGDPCGSFGRVACFSTQTYKHINSGEGGLLVTDDEQLISRAILYSGSYMLYDRHCSRPSTDVFEPLRKTTPNYSCRMDNLRAAVLRPQLENLEQQCRRWNERYRILASELNRSEYLVCPSRDPREGYVGSSIQFQVPRAGSQRVRQFIHETARHGVQLSWYGDDQPVGFASTYASWEYLGNLPHLQQTQGILDTTCDMRIPLTFTKDDCRLVAEIIRQQAEQIFAEAF